MSDRVPTIEKCTEVSSILKALSHPSRLLMLCHLAEAPKTVGELESLTGASQSSVSQYLGRMKLEGLVEADREQQNMVYSIKDNNIRKLIQSLHKIYC